MKSKLDLANMLKMDSDARKQATAEKHFAEAEGVCRTYLKIHKEKIAPQPEFEKIDLEQELRTALESPSHPDSDLSSELQNLIRHSHSIGRTPAEIAAFLGLDADAVTQVLHTHFV